MRNMRHTTQVVIAVGFMAVASLGRAQAQTIADINKAALDVPITNQQAVSAYVAKYGKEVAPLAGYGLMPWGISRFAVNRLSGAYKGKGSGFDIMETLEAERVDGKLTTDRQAELESLSTSTITNMAPLGRITGICFAPFPGIQSGEKDNKEFQFFFVDNQFMGMLMTFKNDAQWQTLLRAMIQKYGQHKTLREKHESSFMHEYMIYEWENDVGVARMILVGPGGLIGKLQKEKIEQAKREMQVKKVEARLEGATETEVQLADQMGDAMMKMLEQQMAQEQGQLELVGISYYSMQLRKYAENKLQQHRQATQEKERQRQQEEEKAKDKEAQKHMNDI